jgi:hypothetical protein
LNSSRIIRGSAAGTINESRRSSFFRFFLPLLLQIAARQRAAEGLDDEQKQNDFSRIHDAHVSNPLTRVDVATILGRFAAWDNIEDIQKDYQLSHDQVTAALAYATHVAEHLPPAVKSA